MHKNNLPIFIILFVIAGCGSSDNNDPISTLDLTSGNYECVSLKTNKGTILFGLDKINAPESVNNYLNYINTSFYDGTIFHRVIDGFMVQGGGFDEGFNKKGTNAPIVNEADNSLLNIRGSIAAARTSDPHSATSQFFINTVDNNFLDFKEKTMNGWGYAVFGQVVSGMDIVDSISKVETGPSGPFSKDVPQENIVIQIAEVISCNDVKQ